MFPHMPARPSDIYTVRLANTETQHSLANRLRKVVAAGGAAWTLDLLEGSGFMFAMPSKQPSPLTGYLHAGLLEEGCVLVSKTTLGEERGRRVVLGTAASGDVDTESEGEAEASDEEVSDGASEAEDHPNLKMRWSWTELGQSVARRQ